MPTRRYHKDEACGQGLRSRVSNATLNAHTEQCKSKYTAARTKNQGRKLDKSTTQLRRNRAAKKSHDLSPYNVIAFVILVTAVGNICREDISLRKEQVMKIRRPGSSRNGSIAGEGKAGVTPQERGKKTQKQKQRDGSRRVDAQ